MQLPAAGVFDVLIAKDVPLVYHANSVAAAASFLDAGALLSRGAVQRRGLRQTPQVSDDLDRRFSLWFDVFVDSCDIHARSSRLNSYGPVLFVLSTAQLAATATGDVWVTRSNPLYWDQVAEDQRWFRSLEELERDFDKWRFEQMIVFRHSGGELPLNGTLDRIILDDPGVTAPQNGGIHFFSYAYGALRAALASGGLDAPIERRSCADGCACGADYASDLETTARMFRPHVRA